MLKQFLRDAYIQFPKIPFDPPRDEPDWIDVIEDCMIQLAGADRTAVADALASTPRFSPTALAARHEGGDAAAGIADFYQY